MNKCPWCKEIKELETQLNELNLKIQKMKKDFTKDNLDTMYEEMTNDCVTEYLNKNFPDACQ